MGNVEPLERNESPDWPAGPRLATVANWFEGGLAILDGEGNIREMDLSLRVWLGLSSVPVENRPFWVLMKERCPAWGDAIDCARTGGDGIERIELSQRATGNSADSWYSLETARSSGTCFVRLASMLPRGAELVESGWVGQMDGEAAKREMFVRLLRAEVQIERLTRHWPGVVFSQRPDYSFESVSGRMEELTGVGVGEWRQQGARFWDVIHEGDAKELARQIAMSAQTRQSITTTFRVRNRVTDRVSYILEHRQPVASGGGLLLGYEGVWLDVTRQTLAEKLVTSAAWKETLGVLTMGLAHDFGNVMAGIHSLSESFLNQVDHKHPFYEGLGLIRKSSMQASQLVHRIVNLHLGKAGERNYHDLNQIVGELLELVRKVIPRRIVIAPEIATEQYPVYVDAFEFRQVIINLALNSADAMPERGRLNFRTSRFLEAPAGARFHGVVPRFPCVCLTVQDTGFGIKSTHLDLLFDPFFTTKSGTKGSGLGLYNARLFAEKHRGGILVESQEGQGATFHVCLPEADFSEGETDIEPAVSTAARSALLLYGPPSPLFTEMAEVLRTGGYHVATAHSVERAAEFLSGGDYSYGAVVVLLESSGVILGAHLAAWQQLQHGLKVILRPIGRERDELDAGLLARAALVLTPDLSPHALLEALQGALNH